MQIKLERKKTVLSDFMFYVIVIRMCFNTLFYYYRYYHRVGTRVFLS